MCWAREESESIPTHFNVRLPGTAQSIKDEMMKKHLQVSDEEFWGDYYRLGSWEMVHKYDSVYFWGTLIYGGVCLVGGVVGGILIVL